MICKSYKVLILGSTNIGKTSIINRYIKDQFTDQHLATPLPVATSKQMKGPNNVVYDMQIWDTSGSEDWLSMNASSYHYSQAVIFVASYDNLNSLIDIMSKWKKTLRDYLADDDYISFLCINKADISRKTIADEDINSCAKSLNLDEKNNQIEEGGIDVFKVSAKDPAKGENTISELFEKVGNKLAMRFPGEESTIDINSPTQKSWCWC